MVTKISKQGRSYEINGRVLIWHPEDDEGNAGNVPDVRVPLRIKMGLVLSMGEAELDNSTMVKMVRAVVPNQDDIIEEMDVNDFQDMFITWQSEYNSLTGGSLGESSPQAPSSVSTAEPSSTTSAPASI